MPIRMINNQQAYVELGAGDILITPMGDARLVLSLMDEIRPITTNVSSPVSVGDTHVVLRFTCPEAVEVFANKLQCILTILDRKNATT